MTEDILKKIKEESEQEIAKLDEYNNYARLRNKLALQEEVKSSFGLPCNRDMYLPEKTEEDIIMSKYRKYASQIEEADTHSIYIYMGTYKPSEYTLEEIEEGYPFEIKTETSDPDATHRYYWKLEGLYSVAVDVSDCEEFEKKYTVIYDDYYRLQQEFIVTAVKENQEKAVSKILERK